MNASLKGSGFVRNLDQLGRVVLPIEWRRTLDISPGDPMEIIPGSDGTLVLRRYVPNGSCTFCGRHEEVRQFAGRPVCHICTVQLAAGVTA
jgi:transcriptional pleiotropic regulator of transition state genes